MCPEGRGHTEQGQSMLSTCSLGAASKRQAIWRRVTLQACPHPTPAPHHGLHRPPSHKRPPLSPQTRPDPAAAARTRARSCPAPPAPPPTHEPPPAGCLDSGEGRTRTGWLSAVAGRQLQTPARRLCCVEGDQGMARVWLPTDPVHIKLGVELGEGGPANRDYDEGLVGCHTTTAGARWRCAADRAD